MSNGQFGRVDVFVAAGRFSTFEELHNFVLNTYDDDGDEVPSDFAEEVGLSNYEPMCLECLVHSSTVPIVELLAEASYADQWLQGLPDFGVADAAVCVFSPNLLARPAASSLRYLGAFVYQCGG